VIPVTPPGRAPAQAEVEQHEAARCDEAHVARVQVRVHESVQEDHQGAAAAGVRSSVVVLGSSSLRSLTHWTALG